MTKEGVKLVDKSAPSVLIIAASEPGVAYYGATVVDWGGVGFYTDKTMFLELDGSTIQIYNQLYREEFPEAMDGTTTW